MSETKTIKIRLCRKTWLFPQFTLKQMSNRDETLRLKSLRLRTFNALEITVCWFVLVLSEQWTMLGRWPTWTLLWVIGLEPVANVILQCESNDASIYRYAFDLPWNRLYGKNVQECQKFSFAVRSESVGQIFAYPQLGFRTNLNLPFALDL